MQSLHTAFPKTTKTSMLDLKQLWHKPFIANNVNSHINSLNFYNTDSISHLYIQYLDEIYAT